MTDIATIMWKEYRELLRQRGTAKTTILTIFVPTLLLGVYMPFQLGEHWVTTPMAFAMLVWVQLFLVNAVIADSFAGERERHTLETLLASRLSDASILLGKIFSAVTYSLLITLVIILCGLVTINLKNLGEGLLVFSPFHLIIGMSACLIAAFFISTVGVLVSLRAATVRQAQQTMGIAIIAIAFLPGLIFNIVPRTMKAHLIPLLTELADPVWIATAVLAGIVVDCILLAVVLGKFKRSKLIYD